MHACNGEADVLRMIVMAERVMTRRMAGFEVPWTFGALLDSWS